MNRMNGIKKKKQYILILPLPFYFYLYYTNNTTNHHNYYLLFILLYLLLFISLLLHSIISLSIISSRRMRFFRLLNILGIGWGGGVLNGGTDSDAHGTEKPRKTRRATGQIIRRA